MSIIRWGIIGCGEVTEVKSGPAFQKASNSQLVAVMRRNGRLAEDYAKRHQVPKWYDNARQLIEDPQVDAVYIATPPGSHLEYVLMTAAAGKPVYVEKPMACNFQECQTMLDACQKAGIPLFVAYYRRLLPRFLKVKDLLESGLIGQVRFVNTILRQSHHADLEHSWHLNHKLSGGGRFVDVACHALDLFDYLLGPIATVRGTAANQAGLYGVEDIVSGQFTFQSGVEGVGLWSFTSFDSYERAEIVGNQGSISFGISNTGPITLKTASGTVQYQIDDPQHVQLPLIQSIVSQLNGAGQCPSTGVSGARTNWVMDRFLEEYRKKYL